MGAYSDSLLFIHIPKCAGTSIRRWLKEYVPGTIDFQDEDSGLPIGHIPLRDIERFTGRPLDSFAKIIAVVRNPYCQQLSQWLFWRERRACGGMHLHDRIAAKHPTLTDWLHDSQSDFHVWYESQHGSSDGGRRLRLAADRAARYPDYGGYYRYWLDVDGSLPSNLVFMRMEDLDKVWMQEVGEFACVDAPELPAVNQGPKSILAVEDALPYYSALGVEIVTRKFEWVFGLGVYPVMEAKEPDPFSGFGT